MPHPCQLLLSSGTIYVAWTVGLCLGLLLGYVAGRLTPVEDQDVPRTPPS